MKDKNLAAVLAFFGGFFGLHRFYLGQVWLGILYLCLPGFNVLLSTLDAIIFLSMDQDKFDDKYNEEAGQIFQKGGNRSGDRYERYRQRELNRRRGNQSGRKRTTAANRKRDRKMDSRRGVRQNRPNSNRGNTIRVKKNKDRELGIQYFKDYDYDAAIEAFERSLQKDPKDIATHWNLACAYSLTEDIDKCLYHLDRGVAFGFDDFERLNTHDALAYVRVQPQFETFVKNNYRLAADIPAPERHTQEDDLLSQTPPVVTEGEAPRTNTDLLDQLQQLGRLREKGLLSETEFAAQKKKLLS